MLDLLSRLLLDAGHRIPALTLDERLAMLPCKSAPVQRPVTIHWDAHQVPFIEATRDDDLAAAMGTVHAHLRLGQMELMRRISFGRIAEIIGPPGFGLDRLVRTFDIGRAVPDILAAMPRETRQFLDAFVRGINHVVARSDWPRELRLLHLAREPWTVGDVVRLGRLVAADVNWIVWLRVFKFRGTPFWPKLWRRLLTQDAFNLGTEAGAPSVTESVTGAIVRSGSNCFAVAGSRSASGAGLLAGDPHLALTLPNPFLIAGARSPSYHAVGLMIPGLPFFGMGRNRFIAWGGASLHAVSSDLVELPPGTELTERVETIRVRGGRSRTLCMRESPFGPVVSDLPVFASGARGQTFALRWIGHRPSDEFSAMLAVARARDSHEFRAALRGYAAPGLEMNVAEVSGRIGQVMAAWVPKGLEPCPRDVLSETKNGWSDPLSSLELPFRFNPESGFVAAANARPAIPRPVIGFHFSPPDRLWRIEALLGNAKQLTVADLMKMQRDVHSESGLVQRDILLTWLCEMPMKNGALLLLQALKDWNGAYDADSRGALALELLVFHLARAFVPRQRQAAYDGNWGARALLWEDLLDIRPEKLRRRLSSAVSAAARDFQRHKDWGSLHRLELRHVLGMLPVIGRRYRVANLPAPGSSETLMKTAHGLTHAKHASRYGSVARHVCDLSHDDENYFALLGGQDGWFGSSTYGDQIALWRKGAYVRLPLDAEAARAASSHCTTLEP